MRLTLSKAAGALAAALSLAMPIFLGAQVPGGEPPKASYELGEFTVSAEAESPRRLAPAGSVAVLEAEDIERSGAASVAEALVAVPGVFLNENGPRGAVVTLSLRGSTSAQVLVILDGQRLNDARQGAPDLAQIPVESIERIELLSGGASAVYGADALGGVLVITSKRPEGRSLALSLENSAYPTALGKSGAASMADGQRLGLEGSLPLGQGGLSFGASAERAANAYPYADSTLRDNAELLSGSLRLGLELPLGAGVARASLSGSYQDAGVPGDLIWGLTPEAWQKDGALRGGLGWSSDALAGGLLSLEVRAQGAFTRIEFSGPWSEDLHDMRSGSADLRASLILSEALELGYGGSLVFEAAESSQFESLPEGQPSRLSAGGYLSPSLSFGGLRIVPSLRYDWNEDYAAGLSAMLGLVWEASEALAFRLSGGSSYRAPTFNELYWPFMSNPELEAERGLGLEAGASYRRGGLSLEGRAFGRLVEDFIKNDEFWIPQNLGRVLAPGAALDLGYRGEVLSATASYEFLHPLDLSGGLGLAEAPRIESISAHQLKASLGLALAAWEAGISGRYASERLSGTTNLPATLVLDLRASLALSEGARLSLAAENLLDAEYQVLAGFPMPGLRILTGLRMEL